MWLVLEARNQPPVQSAQHGLAAAVARSCGRGRAPSAVCRPLLRHCLFFRVCPVHKVKKKQAMASVQNLVKERKEREKHHRKRSF